MNLKQLLLGFALCGSVTAHAVTYNYSSNVGWTQINTGVSIANNRVDYVNCADATSRRVYTTHGLTLTNSWRMDFTFNYSAVGNGGPGHMLAAVTAGTLDPISGESPYPATNQDAIGATFLSTNHTNNASTFELWGGSKDGNNAWGWSAGILLAANTTYYITLERLDQTHGRISVYSNSARTTLVGSQCFAISANVQADLPTLQHGNHTWGGSDRSLTGWVDDTDLNNVSNIIGSVAGSQTICSLPGDPAAFTSSGSGSTGFVSGITGYQWQSSPDGVTWTDIPAANGLTYDAPAGLTATTYYRRGQSVGCGVFLYSKRLTVTVDPCNTMSCEFSDVFNDPAPWTQISTGISVNANQAQYNACIDGTGRRIHRTHGVTLTNSWRLDFDFQFTGVGAAGPGHNLATLSAGTLDPVAGAGPAFTPTNQDAISAQFLSTNQTNTPATFQLFGGSKNDNNAWVWSGAGIVLTQGVTYYLSLERLDATHGRICVYTDPARTVHATNSPQCFAINANVQTNLPVIQHGNTIWGWDQRSLTGWVDNDCLSNLAFTGGTISASQSINCGSTPASFSSVAPGTVPNSSYTISYQWQQSVGCTGIWTDIASATAATYSPPALTQTTCYRRLMLVTGCAGGQVPSNTVTVTVNPLGTLDANFSVTAFAATGDPTYTVNATAVTNGSIWFFWEVSEIDLNTSAVVPGTTVTDLAAWHTPSEIPTTDFPGYVFQTDHKYRITRMVADTCYDTSTVSWTIFHGTSLMPNGALNFISERTPTEAASSNTAGLGDNTVPNQLFFTAFPNPSGGTFEIRYDLQNAHNGAITITDVHGNKLEEYTLSDVDNHSLIGIENLSAGIYFVQFIIKGQPVQTEKIIVVN